MQGSQIIVRDFLKENYLDVAMPNAPTALLGTEILSEIEEKVRRGEFNFLIDILTIFSFQINHPCLKKNPDLAFRCLELTTQISSEKAIFLNELIVKVHRSFIANDVYEKANPIENVIVECSEGSVLFNKMILQLSYPFFLEKNIFIKSLQDKGKVQYKIKFDDISFGALETFRDFTYSPRKYFAMTPELERNTLFHLYQLSKKISHNGLGDTCRNALNRLVRETTKASELDIFIGPDRSLSKDPYIKSICWGALTAYLKNNDISHFTSIKEEIALNINAFEVLVCDGTLSLLMQAYTTGLYAETTDELEKLLFMCIELKEEFRNKITTLIFPGFKDPDQYRMFARYFPNIENIIIRTTSNGTKEHPECFPKLIFCSWIRQESLYPAEYIAEVKHCNPELWVRAKSIKQLKEDITERQFNNLFSWKKDSTGGVSNLFLKSPIMLQPFKLLY